MIILFPKDYKIFDRLQKSKASYKANKLLYENTNDHVKFRKTQISIYNALYSMYIYTYISNKQNNYFKKPGSKLSKL